MLAVFERSVGKTPEELSIQRHDALEKWKSRMEIAEAFERCWPESTFCTFNNFNFMAVSRKEEDYRCPRSIVSVDDVFCMFMGNVENICDLRRHYGLSRHSTEAMLVVEMYKVLRDRAPYPADQVIKDFSGQFAFVLFDLKFGTLFIARDREGGIKLQWGMARDGSLVLSDDPRIVSEACGKSFASFPPGCMFFNSTGLSSFDHPLYKVKAVRREDDEGRVCSVMFQVDLLSRLPSIPRVGSEANWADGGTVVNGDTIITDQAGEVF